MRRITTVVVVLAAFSLAPVGATAGPVLASATRLAAEAGAQAEEQRGTRISTARVSIGLAVAIAGVAMMAIDPEQPVQPSPVSNETLSEESVAFFSGFTVLDVIVLRFAVGQPVLVCEPFCPGDIDDAILGAFVTGAASGLAAVTSTIEDQGWRLLDGPIQPFKERSQGLKYGGAALAVVGVAIAGFWSHVPIMNQLAVSPTIGGLRVGASVGF